MDSIWLTIGVGVTVTVIGTILNTLITNKINEGDKKDKEIEEKQKEDRQLFFKRLDEIKESYVRKDLYLQALDFHNEKHDEKFKNLMEKIEELKKLINEKFKEKSV